MSMANGQVENVEWTLEGKHLLFIGVGLHFSTVYDQQRGICNWYRDSLLASQASSLSLPRGRHPAFPYLFGTWLWVMVLASSNIAQPLIS